MTVRQIPDGTNVEGWIAQSNLLAQDMGDIALVYPTLTAWDDENPDTLDNIVNIVRWIDWRVTETLISSSFQIPNNSWFKGENVEGGGATTNIFKFNTSNKIEFNSSVDILSIAIKSGTISGLTTPLPIESGGTNANSAETARTQLGLVIGTNVQAYDSALQNISDITGQADKSVIIYNTSSWVAQSGDTLRSSLGLAIGTNVQAQNTSLSEIAALGTSNESFLVGNGAAWSLKTKTQVKTLLNLQETSTNLAQLSALTGMEDAETIFYSTTSSSWITKDPSEARLALGLAIGTHVQAYNTQLNNIASIDPDLLSNNDFMVYSSGSWKNETSAYVKNTILGLGSLAYLNSNNVAITGGTISGLSVALPVASGGTGGKTQEAARIGIGCGTIATYNTNNVAITGGTISGLSSFSVAGISLQTSSSNLISANGNMTIQSGIVGSSIVVRASGSSSNDWTFTSAGKLSPPSSLRQDYSALGWSISRSYNNSSPDLSGLGNYVCTLVADLVALGLLV